METISYKYNRLFSIAAIVLIGVMISGNLAAVGNNTQDVNSVTVPDQMAPRLQNLGDYQFPVTTKSARAQLFINQAMVLTYGFNHAEAERSFLEAARLDPDCAMAYWGNMKELKDVFVNPDLKKTAGQELVFTKEDGAPVPKWYIQRLFKKACSEAKVSPYRLHDLRHTFNTNMTKAGVDQVVVMKLTGHKTNAMFFRYSHIDQEQSENAMEKLNGFLSDSNGEAKQAISK